MPPKQTARTFMYLDIEQLQSILSQLDRGLLNTTARARKNQEDAELAGEGGLPFLAKVSGRGSLLFSQETTETRSLHHYVYDYFEAKVEKRKLLRDLSLQFQVESWQTGSAQASLQPGNLFRIKAPLSIFDYELMADAYKMLPAISEEAPYLDVATAPSTPDAPVKEPLSPQHKRSFEAMSKIMGRMYASTISIRIYPDHSEDPYLRGRLNPTNLHYRREDLLFLYGLKRQIIWTVVGLIATTQAPAPTTSKPQQLPNDIEVMIENMSKAWIGGVSSLVVEPPAIGIIPLAIYAPITTPEE